MSGQPNPFGVDFGGSGIKGAPVDSSTGEFTADRLRIETPQPATPEAVADVVAQLVDRPEVSPEAPIGVTIPGIVKHGVVRSAANIDHSWIGVDADALFTERLGRPVVVVNDADAAGYAEALLGAAEGKQGLVVVTTLGTGIGSALIHNGVLVPNAELGHLEIDGYDAETRAANGVREREELSWEEWGRRLTRYYGVVEKLLSPDLFVVGGGVSKHAKKFLPLIEIDTPLIPATLKNTAGIVGAALLAQAEVDAQVPATA
jgi:polyphosphate glucokinase